MGVKILTSLPGLISYDLIEFSPNWLRGGLLQKTVYETLANTQVERFTPYLVLKIKGNDC
jgi:hypothetical protein